MTAATFRNQERNYATQAHISTYAQGTSLFFLHASLLYIYYHKEEARLCVFTRHVHKSKIWRRKL